MILSIAEMLPVWVSVSPQASVTTGRVMLSAEARAIQATMPVVSTSLIVKEDGLLMTICWVVKEVFPQPSVMA